MISSPRALLIFSVLFVAVQACAQKSLPPPTPNVILITVDTLRADHLGAYDTQAGFTPSIDSLARDSIVFDNAAAQVPLTLASHASILTGTYPFHNGVQDFTGEPLDARFQTISQSFKRNGYATEAIVSSFVLDRSWGLSRGFDRYYDEFAAKDFTQKNIALVERRAASSVDQAIAWLKRYPSQPFFLWLHLYDPHSPYDPPEPFRSRFKNDLYSGEIAYADAQLKRLFEFLKQNNLYEKSAIVLLSDHGESLGEHGEREHGFFIYQSTTRVPLLIKPPRGAKMVPRHITTPVQVMDVAPTLLELVNIHDLIEKQFQSSSLVSLMKSVKEDRYVYSETQYPFSSFGWNPLRSLRSNRFKYIDAPFPELYDLSADPHEEKNIFSAQNAVASVLREKLLELNKKYSPGFSSSKTASMSADAANKLRALGYVPFRSPVSAAALAAGLPDPKNKILEFNAILKAGDAIQSGDYAEGTRLLESVKEQEPKLYLVPFMLGEAALRQQHWDTAAQELAACLKLNPQFDQAMTALSRALFALGDLQQAKAWLTKAIDINASNYRAWYQLALMQAKDEPEASAESFKKVLTIQPSFSLAQRDLGMLEVKQRNYADALKHLQRASHDGLVSGQLFNAMGIAYSHTGNQAMSIESYRHAIQLEPGLAEAHLNLGFELRKMSRYGEARDEYGAACRLDPRLCELVPQLP